MYEEKDGWTQVGKKGGKMNEGNKNSERKSGNSKEFGEEGPNPPNDEILEVEASSSIAPHPPTLTEKEVMQSADSKLQEDSEMENQGSFEEDLTPEEIEKMLNGNEEYDEEMDQEGYEEMLEEQVDIETEVEVGLEVAIAASPTPLHSDCSTVKKMQNLDVNNSSLSMSGGGGKRSCDGVGTSATSNLKGGSKKKKMRVI